MIQLPNDGPPPYNAGDSPGSQVYLHRLLQLAVSPGPNGPGLAPVSYEKAKELAQRLEIASAGQLVSLFRDLGLGTLELDIESDRLQVSLTGDPRSSRSSGISRSTDSKLPGASMAPASLCELEKGLIDGALTRITGIPVTTLESRCRGKGDEICRFEAVREEHAGLLRFVPGTVDGVGQLLVGGISGGVLNTYNGISGGGISGASGGGISGASVAGSHLDLNSLRGWFLDLVAREIARARRHSRELTVMYIDLDDLGLINSNHGRSAGDQVIRAVGAALSKSCRSEDYLWHQGEDEFAMLLSDTGMNGARVVARRLTTEVLSAAEYVDVAAKISASIGFSTFPVHADSVPALFDRARSAVYVAKSLGKGRSQVAQRLEAEETDAGQEKSSGAAEHGAETRTRLAAQETAARTELPVSGEGSEEGSASKGVSEPVASVLIASSSPLLIAGMRQVLSDAPGIEIVAEIADTGRLSLAVADLRPDLVFADLGMASFSGFAVLKLLRDQNLPVKFSVFAAEVDQDVIKIAADFSIDGVILQETPAADVLASLRKIYQGKAVLPAEVRDAIRELNKNRRLLHELSDREIEVLRLVAEGKSNSQISAELYITVNTVRFHLANIYQKLSVSNRTEAANYYLRQDLAPDGQTRLL